MQLNLQSGLNFQPPGICSGISVNELIVTKFSSSKSMLEFDPDAPEFIHMLIQAVCQVGGGLFLFSRKGKLSHNTIQKSTVDKYTLRCEIQSILNLNNSG